MGWCSVGLVLTRGEGASLALVGDRSSDCVTIQMPHGGRCFTLTSSTPHYFLLGWLKLSQALLLDQLRLA